MRAIYVALVGAALGVGASKLTAAQIAFDSAGDSAYNNFSGNPSPNGGYGWGGAWQGSGLLLGSSSDNGFGDPQGTGDINSPRTPGGRAWEIPSSPDSSFTFFAFRPFSGSLSPGQTFAIDLDTGSLIHQGFMGPQGFGLGPGLTSFDGTPTGFRFAADPLDHTDYVVATPLAAYVTNVPLTDRGVHVEVTQLDNLQLGVSIASLAPNGVSQYLIVPNNVSLTGVTVINEATVTSYQGDNTGVYFNNISVTPEPTLAMILSLPILLLRRTRLMTE